MSEEKLSWRERLSRRLDRRYSPPPFIVRDAKNLGEDIYYDLPVGVRRRLEEVNRRLPRPSPERTQKGKEIISRRVKRIVVGTKKGVRGKRRKR